MGTDQRRRAPSKIVRRALAVLVEVKSIDTVINSLQHVLAYQHGLTRTFLT